MVEFFKVYRSSFEKTRFKNSKEVDPGCEQQEEVETIFIIGYKTSKQVINA